MRSETPLLLRMGHLADYRKTIESYEILCCGYRKIFAISGSFFPKRSWYDEIINT